MKTPHVLAGAATAVVAVFSLFAPAFAAAATNTTLTVSPETGTYGGTVTLTATLKTTGGTAEANKTVFFNVDGNFVGSDSTNSSGVATLTGVDVSNVSVGIHHNDITASFLGSGGVNGSSGESDLTITKKTLTVSDIGANNKAYDGTVTATLNNLNHATLHGVINFDHVTLVTTGATGAFTDANVGNGKTVNINGLTLSGSDSGNYQLGSPQTTATANITKGTQTFSFNLSGLPAASTTLGDPSFDISSFASAQGTGTTAFTSTSTACSISGSVVSLISAGTCNISASNPGDQNYFPAGPIFQAFTIAAPHVWYVDINATGPQNGATPADAFHTIQQAVAASANGDTINVASGDYAGFTVSGMTGLTITGAGAGSTMIVPTTLIDSGVGHKYTADMKVSVFVNNSTDVTIQGMTIEDNSKAPGAGGPDALLFWNASSGTFENAAVEGTYAINGDQTGQGIAVDAGSGQTTNLTVNNVAISGFQKNGIDAVDGNSLTSHPGTITVNVTGGSITGAGSTNTIAQNGILFWNQGGGTVTGTVNGTAISDLEYAPSPEAAGILAYGSASVPTVSNVSFTDTDQYIDSASSGTSIDATTGNTFDGVSAATASGADLEAIENKLDGLMETSGSDQIFILPKTFIATTANLGINAGLATSTSGDTVLVTPGTYTGDITPPASSNVTVEGDGGPVLDLASGYGINLDNNVDVTDFTFEGLTIDASPSTTYAFKAYKADGLTLKNDTFNGGAGNTGGGVDINTSSNVSISNVTSTGFHKSGFAFTSAYLNTDSATPSSNITLNNITSSNNGWTGISFYTVGNDHSPATIGGSASMSGVTFTGSDVISGNGTNGATQGGIFIEGDSDANVGLGHTPVNTVTSDGTTLDLTHVAFAGNKNFDVINYQTAPVNAIGATFDPGAITGDAMTSTQRTTEDGKIYDQLDKSVLGLVTYYAQTVTVTIDKFLDGKAASTTATTDSFPMQSSWNATNIGSGSGSYALSTTGFNSPNAYEAVTSNMSSGADYATNEVMGSLVGADCSAGETYQLAGYTTGNSFASALGATPTLTSPSLTNLTSNAYVIVWNKYCVPTPTITTPTNGLITTSANLTEVDWTSVTNAVGGITYNYEASYATSTNADGSFTATVAKIGGVSGTTLASPNTPEATYYIHVQAQDADGNVSAWSPIVEVTVDNSPSVTTDAATGVTDTNSTLNGTDGAIDADNTSFWWGTTPITGTLTSGTNPGSTEFPASGWSHDNGLGPISSDGQFNEAFTTLTPGTTYYFVAWVEVGGTWYPGQVMSFTTSGTTPTPSVTTEAATGIDQTDAVVNGQNGGLAADNTSFWWGTSTIGVLTPGANPGATEFPASGWSHDNGLGQAGANGQFNESLSGLTAGTQYSFVAWVESGGIWYPGNVLNFTTAPAGNVETDAATGITPSDATLNGKVEGTDASQVSFWISTTPGIDTSNPNSIPSGVVSTPVTSNVSANTTFSDQLSIATTQGIPSNLPTIQPNTTYYYVAWANVGGTWYPGAELSFTTGNGPAVGTPGVTTDAATAPSDADATLNATNGGVAADAESFWVSTSTIIDVSNPNSIPNGVYSTPVLPGVATSAPFSDQLSLVTTQGITANGNENMMAITPDTTYNYVAWSHVNGQWYSGGQQSVTTSNTPPVAPTAVADTATTNINTPVSIDVLTNDTGSPTSVDITDATLTQPAHGNIALSGNDVVYTPNTGYAGDDSFQYAAVNSVGTSSPATVDVTVTDTATPVLTINGNNPDYISTNSTYSDAGVAISDVGSPNIGYSLSFDGEATTTETDFNTADLLSTSTQGTHTILYAATNNGGNTGYATRTVIVESDETVNLTSTSATTGTISDNPIQVTATFSQPIQSFDTSNVTVANGVVGNIQIDAASTTVTFDVTPATNGAVTVTIPSGSVKDMAGGSTSSDASISFTYAASNSNNNNNNNNNNSNPGSGGSTGNGAPTTSYSPYDLNHDGHVNLLDLNILFENWGKQNATAAEGDFNGDGVINLLDLNLFLANWLG